MSVIGMTFASAYARSDFALYGNTAANKKYQNNRDRSYCQTELGRIFGENNDEKLQIIISVRWQAKCVVTPTWMVIPVKAKKSNFRRQISTW
jgi:hypothetical protein